MSKSKDWVEVFDAHPEVKEIFIGTDANGNEQPFLERKHAGSFAGLNGKVVPLNRPAVQAATGKAPKEVEATAKKQG